MLKQSDDILQKSPDIATMSDYYETVEDILEGAKQIKKKGERYLPMFNNETKEDFKERLKFAKFTNIFRDTLEGLASKPFETKISLVKQPGADNEPYIPVKLEEFVENVDGAGNNLTTYAALTFFNSIGYSHDWIFIDFPSTDGKPLSLAEVKKGNYKPYWTHVNAKNVLDVKTKLEGRKEVVTYFKYLETTYGTEPRKIREYKVTDKGVEWTLWVESVDAESKKTVFISRDGGLMSIDYIPAVMFATGRRAGNSFKFYPAMQDAADLQITLYQDESDLQYTKKLAGYPMLSTAGKAVKDTATNRVEPIKKGPQMVLYGAPNGNGGTEGWKYVEPSANSMEFLKKDIDRTKTDLRELGRQPLTALSSQLTTVTTSIAAGKAKSAVTMWAYILQDALQNALKITLDWMGVTDFTPVVNVYTGFDNVVDDGSDLKELGEAQARGVISQETYRKELKRRNVLSPEFDEKIEIKNLLQEVPSDETPDTNDGVDLTTNKENTNE